MNPQNPHHSRTFLLRCWREDVQWRFELQDVYASANRLATVELQQLVDFMGSLLADDANTFAPTPLSPKLERTVGDGFA